MVSDRQVFETAGLIVLRLGEHVSPMDLDPWITGARRYQDQEVDILYAKQIVYTVDGEVVDAIRIAIRLNSEYSEEGYTYEDSLFMGDNEFADRIVFDYMDTEEYSTNCFLYLPGEWIDHLEALRARIIADWLVPRQSE